MSKSKRRLAGQSTIGCFILCFIILGTMNSYGLFFPSMVFEQGWTTAQITLSSVLSTAVAFLIGQYYGRIIRKIGVSVCAAVGAFCFGAGYFLWSLVPSLWMSYVSAGLRGAGMAFSAQTLASFVISGWYTHNRGTMLGIVLSGGGIGGAILSVVYGRVLELGGWRLGFQTIFALCVVIGVPTALLLVKENAENSDVQVQSSDKNPDMLAGMTMKEIRHQYTYYLLFVVFALLNAVAVVTSMYGASFFVEVGKSTAQSSHYMSIYLVSCAVTTIFGGPIMDKLGSRRYVIVCMSATFLGAVLRQTFFSSEIGLGIAMFLLGTGFSVANQTAAAIPLEWYGRRNYSTIVSKYSVTIVFAAGAMSPIFGAIFNIVVLQTKVNS